MPDKTPTKPQEQGALIVSRNDRLGMRLLPILNAMRLHNEFDIPVKIYWPTPPEQYSNIAEHRTIFSDAFYDAYFIDGKEFKALSTYAVALEGYQSKGIAKLYEDIAGGKIVACGSAAGVMHYKNDDPARAVKGFQDALDQMGFQPEIGAEMARIREVFKDKEVYSYHLRHGDVTNNYRPMHKPWPTKFLALDLYKEHIETKGIGPDHLSLIFGDFEPSLNWVTRNCAGIQRISDVIDLQKFGSLQRDFLELYAMSRSTRLFGPANSGFSQLAASLGGIDFTPLLEDLSPDGQERAFTSLKERLAREPSDFSSDGERAQSLVNLNIHEIAHSRNEALSKTLVAEIERGNQIDFLYQMTGASLLRNGAFDQVLDLQEKSFSRSASFPQAYADLDAVASISAFKLGDTDAARANLLLSVFNNPFANHTKAAYRLLAEKGALNDANFFPMDPKLYGIFRKNSKYVDYNANIFTWEWRNHIRSNFGRRLIHAGSGDKFVARLKDAMKARQSNDNMEARLESFLSLVFHGMGRLDDAEEASQKSRKKLRDDVYMRRRYVQYLLLTKDFQSAVIEAKHAIVEAPEVPIYWALYGEALIGAKKRDMALDAFARAVADPCQYPAITQRYCGELLYAGDVDECERLIDSVIHKTRYTDHYLTLAVETKLKTGNVVSMKPMLEDIAEEAAGFRNISHLLSLIEEHEGNLDAAVKHAEHSAAMTEKIVRTQVHLGNMYIKAGALDKAAAFRATLPDHMAKKIILPSEQG